MGRATLPKPASRRRRWWLALLVVLVTLAIADRLGVRSRPPSDDVRVYHGVTTRAVHVIDGDTFEVALPDARRHGSTTRIRLWGVDCPEADDLEHMHAGRQATLRTRALIESRTVVLWLEPQRTRGRYGRLLAHVDLPEGGRLNEVLLAEGLAWADERWPHGELRRYSRAEREARRHKRGLWAE